jgi:putative tricarboxylic transport membrane protein
MRSRLCFGGLELFLMAVGLTVSSGAAAFQPSRAVEMVVHGGPGSGVDLMAREIAVIMEKEKLLVQRMQVVNKTGGSGAVAMAYLGEKRGQDHTVALFTTVWFITPLTSAEARFTLKDLTPIARLVLEPSVAVVKNDSPYKSLKDFLEAARKAPGQLRQSGGSITSVDNLARLLIQKATGANWAFISFPGGAERIANLLGGHVQIMFMQPQEAGEHIRGANVRVIASLTETRLASFPNVETVGEQIAKVPPIPQNVRAVTAPPGLSKDVVEYWEALFARMVKTPSWKRYLEENQMTDSHLNSSESSKFVESYTAQMRTLLKDAGAKVVR